MKQKEEVSVAINETNNSTPAPFCLPPTSRQLESRGMENKQDPSSEHMFSRSAKQNSRRRVIPLVSATLSSIFVSYHNW